MSDPLVRIEPAIRSALEQDGYEIVGARFGPGRFLRVALDREGGLDLGACERAHRLVNRVIEEHALDPGEFRIEVESPGVDRPLNKLADFERFRGSRVRVTLARKDEDGRRNFTGVLEGADERFVRVNVDDFGPMEIDRASIESVRLHV